MKNNNFYNKLYAKLKKTVKKIINSNVISSFKKTIKENYKFYLVIILIAGVLCIKLPYTIFSPGDIISLKDRIIIENDKKEVGSLNLTYVTGRDGRIINILIALLNSNWDIIKNNNLTYENESIDEMYAKDKLYMLESDNNAIIAAYTQTGNNVEITNTKNIIVYLANNKKNNLKLYDQILKADNINIASLETYSNYVKTKNIGDKITLTIIRDEKEIEVSAEVLNINNSSNTGISFIQIHELNTSPKIEIANEENESGPSGGLMVALEIYNKLTSFDITRGRIISGTGTIDEYGNVGEIGGVKYKILGAIKNNADIFISPNDNCKEAKEVIKDNKSDIELICVATLGETIFKLS